MRPGAHGVHEGGTMSSSGGIGFCGLLTIVLIVLKLINKIQWSWIWVLSPLWAPVILAIIIIVLYFVAVSLSKI